jgi:Flp pilus assembly protein TadD/4-amino-4-deoxy-L-arabinose transferase-like glycosyltransferase
MKPALVFLAAATIGIAYVLEVRDTPAFLSPLVDAYTYDQSARAIAANGPGVLETPYYQPPLYPMLLGAVYRATGGDTIPPRVLNVLLAASTAVLVYILGARVAGSRAGAAGAALFILDGPAIYFQGELLPIALLLFLHTVAIVAALAADRMRRPVAYLAVSGLALGLATAARPTGFLLGLAIALWWAVGSRRRSGGDVDRARATSSARRRALLAAAAAWAIAVLPWTIANLARGGEPILVSWNGGINFYIGNGANSDSLTAIQPGAAWERLQREPRIAGVRSRREESDYWVRRAAREAAGDLEGWGAALGRKALRLFDARETPRNTDWEAFRPASRLLSLPLPGFGIIAPLALLALVRSGIEARIRSLLLMALAAVAMQCLAFFVADRYRMEALPALCVFAGAAIDDLVRGLPKKEGKRGAPISLALAALFAAFVWIDWLGKREIDETREAIHRGVSLRRLERNQEARFAFEEAARSSPRDPDAQRWLGEIALGEERWADALDHFRRAIDAAPDYVRPLLGEAQTLERMGRPAEAESLYVRAMHADPWSADVRLNYGVWLAKAGRGGEARAQFEEGTRLAPRDDRFRRNLRRLDGTANDGDVLRSRAVDPPNSTHVLPPMTNR